MERNIPGTDGDDDESEDGSSSSDSYSSETEGSEESSNEDSDDERNAIQNNAMVARTGTGEARLRPPLFDSLACPSPRPTRGASLDATQPPKEAHLGDESERDEQGEVWVLRETETEVILLLRTGPGARVECQVHEAEGELELRITYPPFPAALVRTLLTSTDTTEDERLHLLQKIESSAPQLRRCRVRLMRGDLSNPLVTVEEDAGTGIKLVTVKKILR